MVVKTVEVMGPTMAVGCLEIFQIVGKSMLNQWPASRW